jgi:Ca2+:H+ antiporter
MTNIAGLLGSKTLFTLGAAVVATFLTAVLTATGASSVLTFIISALALAALASLVGDGTEQLGSRLGPGATGVLQSALGNLPELFVGIFALRQGLVSVVQAALIGSILGNSLLVLGLAFLVGGLRHGTQTFNSEPAKLIAVMTLLSVAAVAIPTMAVQVHTPAAPHAQQLSNIVAVVLLVIFVASLIFVLRGGGMGVTTSAAETGPLWPTWLAVGLLTLAGVASAFVSDWFVQALTRQLRASASARRSPDW